DRCAIGARPVGVVDAIMALIADDRVKDAMLKSRPVNTGSPRATKGRWITKAGVISIMNQVGANGFAVGPDRRATRETADHWTSSKGRSMRSFTLSRLNPSCLPAL